MRNRSMELPTTTNMVIEFEDCTVSMRIPPGATLSDVSERVEQLGKWHGGRPLSIEMHLHTPSGHSPNRKYRKSHLPATADFPTCLSAT